MDASIIATAPVVAVAPIAGRAPGALGHQRPVPLPEGLGIREQCIMTPFMGDAAGGHIPAVGPVLEQRSHAFPGKKGSLLRAIAGAVKSISAGHKAVAPGRVASPERLYYGDLIGCRKDTFDDGRSKWAGANPAT